MGENRGDAYTMMFLVGVIEIFRAESSTTRLRFVLDDKYEDIQTGTAL